MGVRFVIFLTVLTSFLFGSGYYVGFRINSEFRPAYSYMVWVGIYAIVVLQVAGPFFYRIVPDKTNRFFVLRWIMFTCMGISSSMILYTILADSSVIALQFLFPDDANDLSKSGITIALSLVVVTNIVGMAQAVLGPQIYRVNIPLSPEFAALNGFRIAQVSDLHIGPTIGCSYATRVVDAVNALEPDSIALTGDLIDGTVDQLRESVEPLRGLRSRFGTFSVLGNHEFYWRAEEWIREFNGLGFTMLNNEHRVIFYNGVKVLIAGVPDIHSGRMIEYFSSDPLLAMRGAPEDSFKILLAHQPASFKAAIAAGFNLQLSGHTHGGQFFPFTILVRLVQRYVRGLYRNGKLWIYVNRGTGYWGPPVRFLVPPEITLITLTYKSNVSEKKSV